MASYHIVLSVFYSKKTTATQGITETQAAAAQILNSNQAFACKEAILNLKEVSKERKFKESIEAIVRLNVDPRQGDQNIRGTCVLPAGTGKTVRVCVFADQDV